MRFYFLDMSPKLLAKNYADNHLKDVCDLMVESLAFSFMERLNDRRVRCLEHRMLNDLTTARSDHLLDILEGYEDTVQAVPAKKTEFADWSMASVNNWLWGIDAVCELSNFTMRTLREPVKYLDVLEPFRHVREKYPDPDHRPQLSVFDVASNRSAYFKEYKEAAMWKGRPVPSWWSTLGKRLG